MRGNMNLGLAMRHVTFRLGDSLMPPAPPHGGSMTMASVGSAVQDGCDKLRKQAVKLAVEDAKSPLHGVAPTPSWSAQADCTSRTTPHAARPTSSS